MEHVHGGNDILQGRAHGERMTVPAIYPGQVGMGWVLSSPGMVRMNHGDRALAVQPPARSRRWQRSVYRLAG